MEFIRTSGADYPIHHIMLENEHILKIEFADDIPAAYEEQIRLYTSGGIECANFSGFETVYRSDEKVVWLSDDGSTYTPPEEQLSDTVSQSKPSLDELKTSKWNEVNRECTQIISSGVDVSLSNGIEHFALTEADQLNLFGLRAQLAAGADTVPYHADGKACVFYSAADMTKIIETAIKHATYHTTYCNALHTWINAAESKQELEDITYGADVPAEHQSEVLKALLSELKGATV